MAELVRALRFHGSRDKQTFEYVGYNSRLDELQAAILRVLLPRLDDWSAGRRRVAALYGAAGIGDHTGLPVCVEHAIPAWHLYVVTHPKADDLIAWLGRVGVQARGYYRTPLHRQPAMAPFAGNGPGLPVTDVLAATNLAVPMGPSLTEAQVSEVADAIFAFANGPRAASP